MNRKIMAALCLSTVVWSGAHAETVYKYDGADGTPTFSDRPEMGAATPVEKIQLPAGPSEEERLAAEQRVKQMQETSAELEEARLATEEARQQKKAQQEPAVAEEVPAGSSTAYPGRYPTRIPINSPSGGDHPVYDPNRDPGNRPGIPRPPVARPPIARPPGGR